MEVQGGNNAEFELRFVGGGSESIFLLVVGTDSTLSKISSTVTGDKRTPDLYSTVNRGTLFAWKMDVACSKYLLPTTADHLDCCIKSLPSDYTP